MTIDTEISAPRGALPREDRARITLEQTQSSEAAAWDSFAAACGASFRGASRAVGGWQFDHHLLYRMKRYRLWLQQRSGRVQIGQAAIGFGSRLRVFADGLQLLPEHSPLWREAMTAVLEQAGPGVYHYGSRWSLEPAREGDCASIDGVNVANVQSITMYAVDFARWPTWDAYLRDVSSNARRNAKKAEKFGERLVIDARRGLAMLRDAPHLIGLRRGLYARKQVPFSAAGSALRLMVRAAIMRENAFIAVARVDGSPISAFGGVTFGDNTYFVDAGSLQEDNGVYWHLMLRMLRDAYQRAPLGRFVTGAYYNGASVSRGLDFFRYQCRAQENATSEFVFTYRLRPGSAQLLADLSMPVSLLTFSLALSELDA
jgi:hypothetical protein